MGCYGHALFLFPRLCLRMFMPVRMVKYKFLCDLCRYYRRCVFFFKTGILAPRPRTGNLPYSPPHQYVDTCTVVCRNGDSLSIISVDMYI